MTSEFKPHDYQKEMIDFICANKRCSIWAPMGSGKSVSILAALERLDTIEDVYPVLILAPLRVARSTWPNEVHKWSFSKHLRVSVITGTPKQRERALAAEADIYCTNYDQLVWLRETFGDDWPFKTVVADENTRLKSFRLRQGSKRAAALGKIAHTHVNRFIGLTGTPAPNGVKDLWGPQWFVDKGERLGQSFAAFEMRWFRKGYDGYSIVPYEHSQKEIEDKLRDVCLTVRGLPVDKPVVAPVYVDLLPSARKLYDSMEETMYVELEKNGVEAVNAAVKTQKCLQIASGALYTDDEGHWELIHNAKLDALESIIEEANGAAVLVAYHFKHDLERLRHRFPQGRVLDADPSTVEDWNAGRIPLLFLHPQSAGHGLSLQDGGNIIAFFSINWNLEEHQQVIERIGPTRQKQSGYDRPCLVYPILARNTIDEVVMDRLQSKRSVQDALLAAMRKRKERKKI